jgi:hypothetical protein
MIVHEKGVRRKSCGLVLAGLWASAKQNSEEEEILPTLYTRHMMYCGSTLTGLAVAVIYHFFFPFRLAVLLQRYGHW